MTTQTQVPPPPPGPSPVCTWRWSGWRRRPGGGRWRWAGGRGWRHQSRGSSSSEQGPVRRLKLRVNKKLIRNHWNAPWRLSGSPSLREMFVWNAAPCEAWQVRTRPRSCCDTRFNEISEEPRNKRLVELKLFTSYAFFIFFKLLHLLSPFSYNYVVKKTT